MERDSIINQLQLKYKIYHILGMGMWLYMCLCVYIYNFEKNYEHIYLCKLIVVAPPVPLERVHMSQSQYPLASLAASECSEG
jgi:hypothetical protein